MTPPAIKGIRASSMAIDPRACPFDARCARFLFGSEKSEDTGALNQLVVPRDGAARGKALVLRDDVAPDFIASVSFGFH